MGTTRSGKIVTDLLVTPMCPEDKIGDQVKLVTILFGSNDGSPVRNNVSRRMVPLEEYKQNLVDMIHAYRSAGVANILLITPPPRGQWDTSVMSPYADAVLQVGEEQHVPVANFFKAVVETSSWATELLLPDKIHLTPAGNQVLYDTVMGAIHSFMPAVAPKAMIQNVPMIELLTA